MEKSVLKTLLPQLNTGQEVTITFINELSEKTGEYKIQKVFKGKGKGGSQNMVIRSLSNSNAELTVGSPQSEDILHVVVDGKLYGYEKVEDIPPVYPTDKSKADVFKEQFKTLLGKKELKLTIDSSEEIFNGDFRLKNVRQLRGRHGQVILELENSLTGEKLELWSFRHSGIINRCIVH